MMNRRTHLARRGAAAIVMVVLLIVVAVIVIGTTITGSRDQDLSVRRIETVQAFYAAESGMNMAIREVVNDTDEDGDGEIGTISNDSNAANDPTIGGAKVYVSSEESGDDVILSSYGSRGVATRRIDATLTGSGNSPGLSAKYFDSPGALSQLADVNWAASPDATGTVTQLNTPSTSNATPYWTGGPTNYYGAEFNGRVTVSTAGLWTFYTSSDDGSALWVNGTQVVSNDGLHGMVEQSGTITLSAGSHSFRVRFFENTGSHGLIVSWRGPGGVPAKEVIPSSAFTH